MKRRIIQLCLIAGLLSLLFVAPVYAVDNTKATGELQDWVLLDDTGATPTTETSALTTTDDVAVFLHITMAHCNTSAAGDLAGFSILIKSGTTDEHWEEFIRMTATGGTANEGDIDQQSASAQANVYLAATANFNTPGQLIFVKNVGDITGSCLVLNKDTTTDDYITCIDNLAVTFENDDTTYDIVDQWTIQLPPSIVTSKVLFYNTDADANYACRVRYTKVTDLE